MRFHAFDKAPVLQTDTVFGPSRIALGIGLLVTSAFPAAGVVVLRSGGGWFGWWFILFPCAILWFIGRRFVRACGSDAWMLRWNPRRMLIRLGEVFERDPGQLAVLELDRMEIEWVRQFRSTTITKDSEGTAANSTTWLEIKLRQKDLGELRQRLDQVRKPKVWRGWTRYREVPVSITAYGVIRVEWYARNACISPRLKIALRLLHESGVSVRDEMSETNDFTKSLADKAKLEQRIVELVEQGDLIGAVKLARRRYGYSLTEAKRFIDELRGGVKKE